MLRVLVQLELYCESIKSLAPSVCVCVCVRAYKLIGSQPSAFVSQGLFRLVDRVER